MKKSIGRKNICAAFVFCAVTLSVSQAQTVTTLYSFCKEHGCPDGSGPNGPLVQATNGYLYGGSNGGVYGGGTLFKISPSGKLTTLYSFCAQSGCPDGQYPRGGLVQAEDGNLYGTTWSGGANGSGTLFKMSLSGNLTTLYTFCSQSGCADGSVPAGALIQATDGYLYGSTLVGGANNFGTVYKISPGGTLTVLYSFCSLSGCADGISPNSLMQATDGDLYGTAGGGEILGTTYPSTVFKITTGGKLTTLYAFCSQPECADGWLPSQPLMQATNGLLYGTNTAGGANGYGTAFSITTSGSLQTLYDFNYCSQPKCAAGWLPSGAFIQATDGNLYSTTLYGDGRTLPGSGTIFFISPDGTKSGIVHSFSSADNQPQGLVQDTNGTLYGTTYSGGKYGFGTMYSLSLGLGPFVETQTRSGTAGASVKILGTNLTGASSVTFNGAAAAFTVVSAAQINATVPAGATSGIVQVVTPSGTFSSNVPFTVQ